jgi:L-alanine-DL-glutamate epimerase-like enolase superfamily enzyme
MPMHLTLTERRWPLAEPFAISRGVMTEWHTLVVEVEDANGHKGRGEACGILYAGETPETMTADLEGVRTAVQMGIDRRSLLGLLPAAGARCALDAALWDLEAKRERRSPFQLAGISEPASIPTAYTIGIRSIDAYEAAARTHADHALLKIKVDAGNPVEAVAAARRGAPLAHFIVDPNQAWSIEELKRFAPELAALGVVLLEQPIAVGTEAALEDFDCPVPLCADELVNGEDDLARAVGRFQVINIKLDKTGGLTAALALARAARAQGFGLMVGCMGGSSLCIAPALVLAAQCDYVDLDGPMLAAQDWAPPIACTGGALAARMPALWG